MRANLTLAEIAPSAAPDATPETQENPQPKQEQTPPNLTILPPENPQAYPVTPPATETKQTPNTSTDYTTFIIGLNAGSRNVNPGILVRGKVTDTEAIDFDSWLIAYEAVLQALKFTSKVLAENEVELRSPFKIARVNLNQIRKDTELGLVLFIKEILGVGVKFDSCEYAIVFDVPEIKTSATNARERQPVILEGLPKISAPHVTLSGVEQRLTLNETGASGLTNQGSLSAAGCCIIVDLRG